MIEDMKLLESRIRHIEDGTIYPEQLGIGIWHKARQVLSQNFEFPIGFSDEFKMQMLDSDYIPEDVRFNLPLSFRIYEAPLEVSRYAEEWQKLQTLNTLRANAGLGRTCQFFNPWEPLIIYEAHRRGLINVLSPDIDCHNSFYVQSGVAIHSLDIEQDPDNKPHWFVHSWGLGDEQTYPMSQRIFIPL